MKDYESYKKTLKELEQLRIQYDELLAAFKIKNSEHKRIENQFKKSEDNFKAIFEYSGLAMMIIDQEDNILMANNELLILTGYSSEEFMSRKWINYFTKESLQKILKKNQLKEIKHKLVPVKYNLKLLNSKGEILDVVLKIKLIFGSKKRVISILNSFEPQLTEKEIRINKYSIQEDFENAISADYISTVSGKIISCNKAFKRLFGFDQITDIKEFNITNLYKIPEERNQIIRLINEEKKVENYEVEYKTIKGNTIHALLNAIGIFDKENNLEKIRGYVVDNSEHKKIEKELIKFKLSIERSFEAIFMTDIDGSIIYVNPAFEKLYGFKRDECIGKTPRIIKSGIYNEDVYKDFWDTLLSKNTVSGEIVNKTKEGILITVEAYNTSIFDNNEAILGFIGIHKDITELNRQKEELIKSEDKYRLLFYNNPQPMWIYDIETLAFLEVNEVAINHYGYTKEEFLSMTLEDVRPLEDIPKLREDIKNTSSILNKAGEWRHIKKNGDIIDVEITSHKIIFNDRNARYVLINDITDRKRVQLEYQMMIQTSRDGFWIIDVKSGKFIDVNQSYCEMIGYKREELLQMTIQDIEAIENHEETKQHIALIIEKGFDSFETKHKTKSGKLIDIEASVTYIKSATEQFFVFVKDVSERKLIENEVLKLSHATEQSPASIIIADLGGRIEYVNSKLLEITGYSIDELIGQNPRIFSSGEKTKSEYQELWNKISSGNEWRGEFYNKKKNGELYWESASISPILNEKKEIINYIAIKEDITERKKFIADLKTAKEKAEESDRLKSAFLANMSHEIRTPMNGILGFADLLKEPSLSGEEQQTYIKIIEKSGTRMLNIINDIIEFSKIEAGLMTINNVKSNINEQIEYIYTFFKPEVESKGLKLYFKNGKSSKKSEIFIDREKVFAILTNLVKNAIKFSKVGFIEFGYLEKNGFLEFYVKDTGIGIPKERQDAIFERFIQADFADKMAYQGAGLGLSISKSYVESLGGSIWVESEEGIGSTFYFTLPYNKSSC